MFKSLSLKVIIFGFIFTFFSSFGQSFFLGLFNSSIRNELSITHGQFGSIYASATLLSSFLLIWVGKKIDDINISKFALFVILLLSFSSFFFSKISSVAFLDIKMDNEHEVEAFEIALKNTPQLSVINAYETESTNYRSTVIVEMKEFPILRDEVNRKITILSTNDVNSIEDFLIINENKKTNNNKIL